MKFNLLLILSIIGFYGCHYQPSATEQSVVQKHNPMHISLMNTEGKLLSQISDQKKCKDIITLVNNKQPFSKKLLPIFSKKIIIKDGPKTTEWLLSDRGYMKSNSREDTALYIIKDYKAFYQLFDKTEAL